MKGKLRGPGSPPDGFEDWEDWENWEDCEQAAEHGLGGTCRDLIMAVPSRLQFFQNGNK